MKTKHIIYTLAFICLNVLAATAQKKDSGFDKIVFGSYEVTDVNLKEFTISKSGEILFNGRKDKENSHIGHLEKTTVKELMSYCNSKEWDDYVKFNPGKNYQFVRLYTNKDYIEMMWAPAEANADMNELYAKLNNVVSGFSIP